MVILTDLKQKRFILIGLQTVRQEMKRVLHRVCKPLASTVHILP